MRLFKAELYLTSMNEFDLEVNYSNFITNQLIKIRHFSFVSLFLTVSLANPTQEAFLTTKIEIIIEYINNIPL